MIDDVPTTIDPSQAWLVDYWASQLGISSNALRIWVARVGSEAKVIEKRLKDGIRIAIKTDDGVSHLVARISHQQDGFAFSVPYFHDKRGLIFEAPIRYDTFEYAIPMSKQKIYEVSDVVKLSIHRNGFVQFSRGGSKPIVSGFNEELKQPKGAGLHAPDPVSVSSGPICGVVLQGLEGFRQHKGEFAEVFTREDLWYHPEFSKPDCSAYNLEIFMLSRSLARRAVVKNDKLMLSHELPFYSSFRFAFDLRVIDLPHQPFALGLILSPMMRDESNTSGYKLGGPGCMDAETGVFKSIFAMYPKHPELAKLASQSLDYEIED